MRYAWKRRTNAADVFDTNDRTRAVLERAQVVATRVESGFVDPTHLLLAILDEEFTGEPETYRERMIVSLGTTSSALREELERSATSRRQPEAAPSGRLEYTSRALNALRLAMANARRRRETGGGAPEDVMLAILHDEGSSTWKACARAGITKERVADAFERRQDGE